MSKAYDHFWKYHNKDNMDVHAVKLIKQQTKRTEGFETEMQEVSNQLIELYNKCNETTGPEVYGTILGLHERLEQSLKRIYSP